MATAVPTDQDNKTHAMIGDYTWHPGNYVHNEAFMLWHGVLYINLMFNSLATDNHKIIYVLAKQPRAMG